MNITILGASGKTGTEIVSQALAAGMGVTAVVRNPQSLQAQANLTIIVGDVADPQVIIKASQGSDAILSALGANNASLITNTVKAIIEASGTSGVRRVILESAFITKRSQLKLVAKIMTGLAMKQMLVDKEASERLLKQSQLDWTIVRPTVLTQQPKSSDVRIVPDTEKLGMGHKIGRADVAAWMLDEVANKAYVRQDVVISQT